MRRVREWPRLMVAVAVLAVVLVLIGVVVASAASGGSADTNRTTTAGSANTPLLKAPKSNDALVKNQAQTITRLRSVLSTQHGEIAKLQQQLRREREMRKIRRHAKAKHHSKQHANRR